MNRQNSHNRTSNKASCKNVFFQNTNQLEMGKFFEERKFRFQSNSFLNVPFLTCN